MKINRLVGTHKNNRINKRIENRCVYENQKNNGYTQKTINKYKNKKKYAIKIVCMKRDRQPSKYTKINCRSLVGKGQKVKLQVTSSATECRCGI